MRLRSTIGIHPLFPALARTRDANTAPPTLPPETPLMANTWSAKSGYSSCA